MAGSVTKVVAQATEDQWALYNADCVDVARGLPDGSVHYTIFSPPFESLYTFSDDPRDMSNCTNSDTFWAHFRFLIAELHRITMPGRLCSIHCMQLPTSKLRDGFIGLRDFRGEIIRAFAGDRGKQLADTADYLAVRRMTARDDAARAEIDQATATLRREAEASTPTGFVYHSEVCIRKDPVAAMQRSKSIGLLHKQLCKDSALSRQAVADYIVTMRKLGDNPEPVAGPFDAYYGTEAAPDGPLVTETGSMRTVNRPGDDWYSVAVWQRYAEPVWMDIAQGDVLSHKMARDEADERHISPLQLTPIRRCIQLWSNPGDIVFSPFAGIGSELYVAVELGRKAIGAELKASYYRQAIANLQSIKQRQIGLFDASAAE